LIFLGFTVLILFKSLLFFNLNLVRASVDHVDHGAHTETVHFAHFSDQTMFSFIAE
jgi:hypothetical protein